MLSGIEFSELNYADTDGDGQAKVATVFRKVDSGICPFPSEDTASLGIVTPRTEKF